MAYLLHRQHLLLAALTAILLAVTLNLASPAVAYADSHTINTTQKFPSESKRGKCQCGW